MPRSEERPRYKIAREIGRGAFGVVYVARDNVLRRDVALKVMSVPEGLTDEEREHLVERFYREARAAAGLSHPNIVVIHDISKAGERHFISMEMLEGEPLSEVIEDSPMSLSRSLRISDEILAGLSYAHDRGVVHRDIKPDNIFLLDGDAIKLVDFGLARVQASTTITRSGTVMGSPGYIAPEVIDGKPADKRTDVFSFGVVLYEMLTGKRPFGPDTAFESFVRVIYRIMSEDPPGISSLNSEVPVEIEQVVGRALAKDPELRFQDAGEMREALAEAARGLDLAEDEAPARVAGNKKRPAEKAIVTGLVEEAATVSDSAASERADATKVEMLQFADDLTAARPKRSVSLKLAGIVAGAAILLGGIAVFLLFLFGVFGGSSEVKVPNVMNLARNKAVSEIKKAGLKAAVEEGFFNDTWQGNVGKQYPSAGVVVPKGSTVRITVSMGNKVAQVPDVLGQPEEQAKQTIQSFQFEPKVESGYDPNVAVGSVYATNPAPQTLKPYGTVVKLFVNSGVKPPNYVETGPGDTPRGQSVPQTQRTGPATPDSR